MGRSIGRKNFTPAETVRLLCYIAVRLNSDGQPARGALTAAAAEFKCHRNTMRAIWQAQEKLEDRDVEETRGRPRMYDEDELQRQLLAVPIESGGPSELPLHLFTSRRPHCRSTSARAKRCGVSLCM
jgi:hypothetical protein